MQLCFKVFGQEYAKETKKAEPKVEPMKTGPQVVNPSIQSMRNQPVEVQRMQPNMMNNRQQTTNLSTPQRSGPTGGPGSK